MTPQDIRPMVSSVFALPSVSEAREWALGFVWQSDRADEGYRKPVYRAPSSGAPPRTTQALSDRVLWCHYSGFTRCEAQRRCGISKAHILRIAKSLGVEFRAADSRTRAREEYKELEPKIRKCMDAGVSFTGAQDRIGIGHAKLKSACEFLGIDYPRLRVGNYNTISDEKRAEIIKAVSAGLSDVQVAAQTGIHRQTVARVRRKVAA